MILASTLAIFDADIDLIINECRAHACCHIVLERRINQRTVSKAAPNLELSLISAGYLLTY
jgi:hypothetical protein